MSRDITKSVPLLQEFWPRLNAWYSEQFPGRTLIVTHVDRTPVEQLTLFCQGRLPDHPGAVVTDLDGFVHKSKHNAVPAKAIDVAVIIAGKPDWDEDKAQDLSTAVHELGYDGRIIWGGTWASHDRYHFEVA
jgi:hypothetical protein